MDFIERWFGMSPDGGSGTTEALLVVAAVGVVVALTQGRRIAAGLTAFTRRRNPR